MPHLDAAAGARQFWRMDIVRRLFAVMLVLVGLIATSEAAMASVMPVDHMAMADCPHAALQGMGDGGHMTHVAGKAPQGRHNLPPVLPICCYAAPSANLAAEALLPQRIAAIGAMARPLSDRAPRTRAIGPDLPPPRL
ncbi:hypothetical protein OSH11_17305 [Kaistia dalseonensis]|uniref:DUF2946 domain-containing protein n=1 Tax=Kaistia dalseonensis TaxID=410840 RepID=A0ABU0H9U0_9HYPH|nr:hypothetical protein [Kaistia dalseonensis]MCX5496467.1 hypothetical protein [Kaistia dalseonensis]MDQ0439089.1 hypothetical protein [Kaistia dalseonensis]